MNNPARIKLVDGLIESLISTHFQFEDDMAYITGTLHRDSGMKDRIQGGEMMPEQEKYLEAISKIPNFSDKWELRERVLCGMAEARMRPKPLIDLMNLRCRKNCVNKAELSTRLEIPERNLYYYRDEYLEIMYRHLLEPWQRVEG